MNCGCNPISEPFEFEIKKIEKYYFDSKVILPNKTDRTDCLKLKIILDYFKIISQLECGIEPDIEILLEEISLIDMKNNFGFNTEKKLIF